MMHRVGDKVFITRGSHMNETGTVVAVDSWCGSLTVDVDDWPGTYEINPETCINIIDKLNSILDHLPTWSE